MKIKCVQYIYINCRYFDVQLVYEEMQEIKRLDQIQLVRKGKDYPTTT